ncbi:Spy/CpxP family protein refolding chaperone [Endozoicomonas sp. 4G]|uniref:Spy/CpxP family protein refolding chaperone n=1 Tax=Endozoicomonas sp. 4G TaxID=2872754 RepID=UPI0020786964|nr:Spy/CpxP family protein refolding chaperone [Endozoicomonas sp. 4G]
MKLRASFYSLDTGSSPVGIILVTALLAFFAVGVKAAPTEALTNQDEAYSQLEQKLNLTDEQKPRVDVILQDNWENIKKIRASDESRLSKIRALKKNRDETKKRLARVLNDQQMQTYQELRKEMRDNLKEYRDQKTLE